jgi:aldose 1-epimerase
LLTCTSYFNLTGGPSIEGTVVTLATNSYLPVDDGGIPTDGPKPFSKVEANKAFSLGAQEPDIDDCFIVNETPNTVPIDTRSLPLSKHVSAHHPDSKIHLEVLSTEPAFQFYTGKYIDVPEVPGAPARKARSGFCVEPSRWVNACNVDEWKSQMLLKKGEKYGCRIVYRAWKE